MKVRFKNSRGVELAGIIEEPENPVGAVIMAHGFASHKESRGKFVKMGELLKESEILAFRYDAGGSGESGDAPVTLENYVDDLKSAITLIRDKGFKRIGLDLTVFHSVQRSKVLREVLGMDDFTDGFCQEFCLRISEHFCEY